MNEAHVTSSVVVGFEYVIQGNSGLGQIGGKFRPTPNPG